jgi:hypothetical protein
LKSTQQYRPAPKRSKGHRGHFGFGPNQTHSAS